MSDVEVKTAVDNLAKTFEEFKAANDQSLAEIKKGKADAVLTEKVDRINAAVTAAEEKVQKLHEEMQAKLNTLATLGRGGSDDARSPEEVKHAGAFLKFMRTGSQTAEAEIKAMSIGSEPDGGFLVPSVMDSRIIKRQYNTSPVRELATVVQITNDAYEALADNGDVECNWVAETQSRADTSSPTLAKIRIPVHEIAAQPKATQNLLNDASLDIESWLVDKIGDRFGRKEAAAFVVGNGSTQPRGLASYATAATADNSRAWGTLEHIATGSSGAFGSDPTGAGKVLDLIHAMKTHFLPNSRFFGKRSALAELRKLKDSDGAFIYVPSMVLGIPATICGYPVAYLEDMPAIASNSLSIGFGDIRAGYTVVDRMGTVMLRDPYTDKPNVKFYATKRVGGDVVDFDAIKFLKFAAS